MVYFIQTNDAVPSTSVHYTYTADTVSHFAISKLRLRNGVGQENGQNSVFKRPKLLIKVFVVKTEQLCADLSTTYSFWLDTETPQ